MSITGTLFFSSLFVLLVALAVIWLKGKKSMSTPTPPPFKAPVRPAEYEIEKPVPQGPPAFKALLLEPNRIRANRGSIVSMRILADALDELCKDKTTTKIVEVDQNQFASLMSDLYSLNKHLPSLEQLRFYAVASPDLISFGKFVVIWHGAPQPPMFAHLVQEVREYSTVFERHFISREVPGHIRLPEEDIL